MIIRLVKWIEVEVETNDPIKAMQIVDEMDSSGSLCLQLAYFNVEDDSQLN